MIYLLTQEQCPKCRQVELLLEKAFRNRYAAAVEVIRREEQPEKFHDLAQRFGIQATPVFIAGEDVLRDPGLSNLERFIKDHL